MLLYLLSYVGIKANGLTLVIGGEFYFFIYSPFYISLIIDSHLSNQFIFCSVSGVIGAFSLPLAYKLQQVKSSTKLLDE